MLRDRIAAGQGKNNFMLVEKVIVMTSVGEYKTSQIKSVQMGYRSSVTRNFWTCLVVIPGWLEHHIQEKRVTELILI